MPHGDDWEMALKQQQKVFLIPKFVFQAKDKDEVSCTFNGLKKDQWQ